MAKDQKYEYDAPQFVDLNSLDNSSNDAERYFGKHMYLFTLLI